MEDVDTPEQGELAIARVGDRLLAARAASGKSLADISTETRIAQRHLEALENSQFESLPGRTYVSGFTRAYARAVGLNEAEIAAQVRDELNDVGHEAPAYEAYQPTDPVHLPSRTLVTTALIVLALLAGGYVVWRQMVMEPSNELVSNQLDRPAPTETADDTTTAPAGTAMAGAAQPASVAVAANAPVVITAQSEVWIGFDDAQGKTPAYRTLAAGQTYTVPQEYVDTMTFRTSRPQAMTMTVGGRAVPTLGPADTLVKNISLKPADLVARIEGGAAPAAAPATTAATPTTTR